MEYVLRSICVAGDAGVDWLKFSRSLQATREDGCVLDDTDTQQKPPVAQDSC